MRNFYSSLHFAFVFTGFFNLFILRDLCGLLCCWGSEKERRGIAYTHCWHDTELDTRYFDTFSPSNQEQLNLCANNHKLALLLFTQITYAKHIFKRRVTWNNKAEKWNLITEDGYTLGRRFLNLKTFYLDFQIIYLYILKSYTNTFIFVLFFERVYLNNP